jgi:type IV pilus assembly protein PilM
MLGLDICSSSVKLVELGRHASGQLLLAHCGQELLQPGWVHDGQIDKFDEVVQAVRRLVRRSGSKARNVAMALPASAVITRKIHLPAGLTEAELELQVEAEANQYIPFPMDEVSLDFCTIGPNAKAPDEIDVMIAASRKEKVQDIQGLAEAAGLKLSVLDVQTYASRRAAERLIVDLPLLVPSEAIMALFEISSRATRLQVLQGQELLYERDQAFGGAQLTQLIVREYGFSLEEAESRKRSGDLPDDYPASVLAPFLASAAQEVGRALQFFFTSTPHSQVDHILLAGGASAVPGLATVLHEQTGFACTVAQPFHGMDLGSRASDDKLLREAPSYLTACGLALRRFAA